jgi:hypothetical protein
MQTHAQFLAHNGGIFSRPALNYKTKNIKLHMIHNNEKEVARSQYIFASDSFSPHSILLQLLLLYPNKWARVNL